MRLVVLAALIISAPALAVLKGPPSPVIAENGAKGPVPLNNPGTWVTTNDYPAEALRNASEGAVGFRLTIDAHGQVSDCEITASSGFPTLDQATCALIRMRARFTPGKDASGKPAVGSYSSRVKWQIPKDMPQPTPGDLEIAFVVDEQGRFTYCKIIKATGSATKAATQADPCQRQQKTQPFTDANGKPVRKLVKMKQSMTIEDVPPF